MRNILSILKTKNTLISDTVKTGVFYQKNDLDELYIFCLKVF